MPFTIVRNDITHMHVDAIVNAANERLLHGGGVCGAIFAAAGPRELQAACDRIGHCDTGSAVATPAFALPARHVIHAVGPIWHGGDHGEEEALRGCYRTSLHLAKELGDTSIAFPLISSGIYGYPKEQAIDVALDEIRSFLSVNEMDVYLILFDVEAMRMSTGRFGPITELINDLYVLRSPYRRSELRDMDSPYAANSMSTVLLDLDAGDAAPAPQAASGPREKTFGSARRTAAPPPASAAKGKRGLGSLRDLLTHLDEPFSTTLLHMIDQRGLKDSDVYKRANMSRQHFSKIRNNRSYRPKKQTVLALAVALELPLDDTRLLLERAGFALTRADERDVIVTYFMERGIYDIYEINLALYTYDQPLLG